MQQSTVHCSWEFAPWMGDLTHGRQIFLWCLCTLLNSIHYLHTLISFADTLWVLINTPRHMEQLPTKSNLCVCTHIHDSLFYVYRYLTMAGWLTSYSCWNHAPMAIIPRHMVKEEGRKAGAAMYMAQLPTKKNRVLRPIAGPNFNTTALQRNIQ